MIVHARRPLPPRELAAAARAAPPLRAGVKMTVRVRGEVRLLPGYGRRALRMRHLCLWQAGQVKEAAAPPPSLAPKGPTAPPSGQGGGGTAGAAAPAPAAAPGPKQVSAKPKPQGPVPGQSSPGVLVRNAGRASAGSGSGAAALAAAAVAATWHLVTALKTVPLVPLALGFAGAIPFVALAPLMASHVPLPEMLSKQRAEAQAAYGACILSFLGAPHWGLAMANHAAVPGHTIANFSINTLRFGWSVIPSLLAWPALLLPPVQKFAVLITSLGLALGVDAAWARLNLVPKWYMPLRVALTGVAMLSLGSSLSVELAKPLAPLIHHLGEGDSRKGAPPAPRAPR
eukprot:jgi/Mesen1/9219/ME000591S08535